MAKSGYNSEEIIQAETESKTCIHLTPEEREVILVMDDKDRKWKASCSSPTYMRKFEAQGWKCTETQYYRDGTVCTKFYEAPCKSISIGKYERPKRVMSEEQIEKMRLGREKHRANSSSDI
jgi:hypothetical protein